MGKTVISVEHLSKRYDLGVIGTGTISRDLSRWWARLRGNPDPYLKIGQVDCGNREGDSIWALNDINFQVEQGETLGIIGANGAGKSTLLKILSRVTGPTSGLVKIKGRVGSLLEVGTGFHKELTGRENIYLNGAILGMRRAEVDRKFDEIVDFSGVEKFIDTPVKRYSSGMYVRLAFAVAAHLQTDILIVDEVLAVGDAAFQKKCLGKMGKIAGEGRTVLFVSHNMGAIRRVCEESMLLKKGKFTLEGQTDTVIDYYLNRSNETIESEIKWTDDNFPGTTGFIRIIAVRLLNINGELSNTFFLDQDFYFEVEYEILRKINRAWLGFKIDTFQGETILCSGDHNYGHDKYVVRLPGIYHTRFRIPKNLLNENNYYISLLGHIPGEKILIDEKNVISFKTMRSKYVKEGRSPGLILAHFDWNTKKCGEK